MFIQRGFLQSKIARRIFGLFVVAALLPIVLTSYLSYEQVRSLIEQDRLSQLKGESKQLSTVTYERLLNIQYRLKSLPDISESMLDADLKVLFSSFASSVNILDVSSMTNLHIFGKSPKTDLFELAPKQNMDRLHIMSVGLPGELPVIYLIKPMGASFVDNRFLVVSLKTEYLWPPEYASYGIYELVYSANGELLYRADQFDKTFPDGFLFNSIRKRSQGLIWASAEERYLVAARTLFLEGDFNSPDWIFVSLQPVSFSKKDLQKFSAYFIPPIILSICLVSIVSLIVIRRSLVPIDKLLEGTRKVGEKNFSHSIVVDGDDEFSILAKSFNHMSSTLKTQFEIYDNLSALDQLILRSEPKAAIVGTAISGLLQLTNADCVFLVLNEKSHCDVYYAFPNGSLPEKILVNSPIDELMYLESAEKGRVARESAWLNRLDKKLQKPGSYFHIFLLSDEEQVYGAVIIANQPLKAYTHDAVSTIKDYASKVAIAIEALNRREQLLQFATVDALTNVSNRRQMKALAEAAIDSAKAAGCTGAFLFVDLDRFKNVNDVHGHKIGDLLLLEAATRLTNCVPDSCTVSRFGGDEFAVLVPRIDSQRSIEHLSERIIQTLSRRYVIEGLTMYVGASLGIATFSEQSANFDDLLQNADIAMYKAKGAGRGAWLFYSDVMGEERLRRAEMETEIREALNNNDFQLYYQPKVDARSGIISGFEVLLRWHHKTKGFIPPLEIISVAEETGLILELDDWVFRNACVQIAEWQKVMPRPLVFAINVSASRLALGDFIEPIKKVLLDSAVSPEFLEIEITETVFMDDRTAAKKVLNAIHELGIKIALDDFGTGYSSLSYLSYLPIDTLKIDRAFTCAIGRSKQECAVVNAIIALAHSLNMGIVAEGVESNEQVAFLSAHAGGQLQGYLFSKPVPAIQAQVLVKNPCAYLDQFLRAKDSVTV